MTTRLLPRDEWPRLAGTELGDTLAYLSPLAEVYVVEDSGVIVGTWALMQMAHVEGLWIAPGYRQQATVARRLWVAMRRRVRDLGFSRVLTGCVNPQVETLLVRAGADELPCKTFAFQIGG